MSVHDDLEEIKELKERLKHQATRHVREIQSIRDSRRISLEALSAIRIAIKDCLTPSNLVALEVDKLASRALNDLADPRYIDFGAINR